MPIDGVRRAARAGVRPVGCGMGGAARRSLALSAQCDRPARAQCGPTPEGTRPARAPLGMRSAGCACRVLRACVCAHTPATPHARSRATRGRPPRAATPRQAHAQACTLPGAWPTTHAARPNTLYAAGMRFACAFCAPRARWVRTCAHRVCVRNWVPPRATRHTKLATRAAGASTRAAHRAHTWASVRSGWRGLPRDPRRSVSLIWTIVALWRPQT